MAWCLVKAQGQLYPLAFWKQALVFILNPVKYKT
jgi:hypothetical protein